MAATPDGGPTSATAEDGPTANADVWYVAYGSNMHLQRLHYYLRGGRPPNAARTYPGCRDPREPAHTRAVTLPGRLYFAHRSRVWNGGMAFYDPAARGRAPASAHLVTREQFADLAAQEMHRAPGSVPTDLRVPPGGRWGLGPGRYETLVHLGDLDGRPMLTFTAPWGVQGAELNPPTVAYLVHLAAGLAETHGWSRPRAAAYLARCPGAAEVWTPRSLTAALNAHDEQCPSPPGNGLARQPGDRPWSNSRAALG